MIRVQDVPFFVVHYTPLADRRRHLEQQLTQYRIREVGWVTEKDIAHYDLAAMYDASAERLRNRMNTPFRDLKYGAYRVLKKYEIEVTAQHIEVYRRILTRSIPDAVVLEDDVVLERRFLKRFGLYVRQLPDDYDVLYFGAGGRVALHVERSVREKVLGALYRKNVFRRGNYQSRYADSYLISLKAAARIVPQMRTFQFPIDWEMNYVQTKLRMNVYWAEPTLSRQGSASGRFESGLVTARKGHAGL
jgi:GR25 family glycosyltransferase involved in LPS biosynthesis